MKRPLDIGIMSVGLCKYAFTIYPCENKNKVNTIRPKQIAKQIANILLKKQDFFFFEAYY